MIFYDQIAPFYDLIFPYNPDQYHFLMQYQLQDKRLLDVGCAKGTLLFALENNSKSGVGIDLNQTMIQEANKRMSHIQFYTLNMLDINQLNTQFDLIYCFGNTLVHLESQRDVLFFFQQSYNLLPKNGLLLIQIINYERIYHHNIDHLPTIQNKDITMERKMICNNNHLQFITKVTYQNQTYDNEVRLYPYFKQDLIGLLEQAHFHHIELFGDFKNNPYDSDQSMHLIVKAQK